jgi:RIO kinase 1
MEFIGSDGVAAPRLRDADISVKKMRSLFTELIVDVRMMYQKCRLVHADLSEYNLLFHEGHIWIIDVSQSVDQDHPRCLEFLREDLLHVIQYFAKCDVAVPTVRELFDFVTDPAINDENMEAVLEALSESAESNAVDLKRVNAQLNALNSADPDSHVDQAFVERRAQEEIEANVFQQAYIPRALDEVDTFERDQKRLIKGGGVSEGIYYQTITGMESDLSGVRTVPTLLSKKLDVMEEDDDDEEDEEMGDAQDDEDDDEDGDEDEDEDEDAYSEYEDEDGNIRRRYKKQALDKEKVKADRKAAAKAQKAAQAEKRKTKIPKHVKKSKTKKGKK